MRDLVAVVVAVALVVVALRLATSLQWYKRGHARARREIRERGQTIVAEIPGGDGLRFFTEDAGAFYWAGRKVPKDQIRAARVLISGAPLSQRVSSRFPLPAADNADVVPKDLGGIERDRWDVAIVVEDGTVLVECGAIRERVSQELARHVFDAVSRDIEARERVVTTPAR